MRPTHLKNLYQLVPHARNRDAIGKMVLGLQQLFAQNGWNAKVITETQKSFLGWGPLYRGLKTPEPWKGFPPPQILMYHHSVGTKVAEAFKKWPAERKILIYHNITPPQWLRGQSLEHAQWGLAQLKELIAVADVQVGLSAWSCQELKAQGATRIRQLPFWLADDRIAKPRPRKPTVLIVGRLARHKQVLEGVLAFAELHDQIASSQLVIVGSLRDDSSYVQEIEQCIQKKQLGGAVRLVGKVSQARLNRLYETAAVLLTLSAHEGFCVPLVEAMRAGLPVVALASAAIPETIGTAGILVEDTSVTTVAAALKKLIEDKNLRAELEKKQAVERRRFATGPTALKYLDLLTTAIR